MPGRLSNEGRRKIALAQMRRWAKYRIEAAKRRKSANGETIAGKLGRPKAYSCPVHGTFKSRWKWAAHCSHCKAGRTNAKHQTVLKIGKSILFNVRGAELVLKADGKERVVASFAYGGKSEELARQLSRWVARTALKTGLP